MADFLGKSLTDEQLSQLTEHLRFDNFAKNESVNFSSRKKLGFFEEDGKLHPQGENRRLEESFQCGIERAD